MRPSCLLQSTQIVYSGLIYRRFAGAFVGCSLEGSVVTTRTRVNSQFYGSQSLTAADVLLGSLPRPPAAAVLYRALGDLYEKLER